MAVEIIGGSLSGRGENRRRIARSSAEYFKPAGPLVSRETFTQSTATGFRSLNLDSDITTLGVGTASGIERNRYSLATGAEETRRKFIYVAATGEAYLHVAGTATGLFVFSEADDFVSIQYLDGKWRVLSNTATVATST